MINSLIWFRSDLRVADNKALSRATAAEYRHCYGLYIISHAQWDAHDMGQNKRDFVLRHVAALQEQLRELGIPLLVVDVPRYADIPQAILALCQQYQIDQLWANYEYPVNEIARDQAVVACLSEQGIDCEFLHDFVARPPGSIRNQSGEYYKVFTPFKKRWLSQISEADLAEHPAQAKPWPAAVSYQAIRYTAANAANAYSPVQALWPVGTAEQVQQQLQHFVDERGADYQQQRDLPGVDGTSRLSAYLAVGAISIRACLRYARFANHGQLAGGQAGLDTWLGELVWREFYQHILIGFPQVCRSQPFQPYTRAVPWRDSDEDLQAWQNGQTGIPIVDAAMRQLNQTGWMHNRLRMVVAMFLSKNLLLDWRAGERYFARQLVDWEFGANNGGWQWAASTGTDAAPYFRVFNPVSQSQRFDPEGAFIRRYVPELAHLDQRQIHEPHAGKGADLLTPTDYPHPLLELKSSRQRAIQAFKQAKADYATD